MNYYKILLSFLLLLAAAVPYVVLRKQRVRMGLQEGQGHRVDIFSPAVAFPLAYAFIYSIGSFDLSPHSLSVPIGQYFYYFIGLGGYFLGLFIANACSPVKKEAIIPLAREFETEFPFLLVGFFLMLFFSVFVFFKAGIPLAAPDVETARTLMVKKAGGWLYYMYKTLPLFTALLVVYKWKHRYDTKKIMLGNFLIVTGLVVIALGAYRGPIVTIFLLLLITYHYLIRPLRVSSIMIVGVISFLLYSVLGAIRSYSVIYYPGALFYKVLVEISNPAKALSIIVSNVPSNFPFFNGKLLLNAFYSLLPGEQLAYGLVLKDMLDMYFVGGGFTPSLLGGLYLDFGIFGIVVFMCLCGIVLHYFYRKMISDFTPYNIVIYAFVLQYLLICIRGGLLQEILPIWFLFVLFFLRIITEKRQAFFLRS